MSKVLGGFAAIKLKSNSTGRIPLSQSKSICLNILLDDILYTIRLDIKKNVATYYKMTEYVFYLMYALDESITQIYIGSTKNLFDRQSKCKNKVKNVTVVDKKHQFIRDNGGFKAWGWKILETGIYNTDLDSLVREEYWIQLYQPELNSKRAFASDEWKKKQRHLIDTGEPKKLYNKLYCNINKTIISEKCKLKQQQLSVEQRETINARQRANRAAKKALLLQPDEEYTTSPHEV
jgi:hypothetical protein